MPKGLPSLRGFERQINFMLGSQIPKKLVYRGNTEETKSLKIIERPY